MKKEIRGRYISKTDKGRVRLCNEDRAIAISNAAGNVLMIVADGMGGHNKGDYASQTIVDVFKREFYKKSKFINRFHALLWFERTLKNINKIIYAEAQKDSKYSEMGSTFTGILLYKDIIYLINVGDSRAYFVDPKSMKVLSDDQTYVDYLYKIGSISKEDTETRSDRHVLMNAVGIYPSLCFDISRIKNTGKSLLICSDGLYNNLYENEMFAILNNKDSIDQKVATLINVANNNAGSDNIAICYWEKINND